MNFSSDTMNLAVVGSTGFRPVRPGPHKEVIVGGQAAGRYAGAAGVAISGTVDEVVRQFGRRVYDLMLYDSAVSCAVALFKAGVLGDGLQVTPGVKRVPGEIQSERKLKADAELAQDIADSLVRGLERMEESIDSTAEEMMDAFCYGNTLAELTFEWAKDGPDLKDRLMPRSMVPKPHWSWGFRVDQFNKTTAIRGWTGDDWKDIDIDKFAVLTWKPKNRDPRGQSGLRPVYNPWNLKVQQYPEFGEYLHHFAQPGIAVTAGEKSQPRYLPDPVTGKVITQDPLDAIEAALAAYRSRAYLALPFGSTAGLLQNSGNGEAYHGAFDRFDLEIFRAILMSARPLQEAKHGSKADSESGLDLVALAFKAGRRPLSRMFENSLFYQFTLLNWGKDVAARLTPTASFGTQNSVAGDVLTAFSTAYTSGFLDESQLPILWERLGLPPVDDAAWTARLQRKEAAAEAAAQAAQQLPGISGKPAKGPDGKPVKPAKGPDGKAPKVKVTNPATRAPKAA